MVLLAQYNPSTGKASYKASTEKAEVVTWPDCSFCATPGRLQVDISSLVVSCCDFMIEFDPIERSQVFSTSMATLLNDTFILEPLGECSWRFQQELAEDTYFFNEYENFGCTGTPTRITEINDILITYEVAQPVATPIGRLKIEWFADDFLIFDTAEIYESTGIEDDCIPSDTLTATLICPDGDDVTSNMPEVDSAVVVVTVF